MQVGDPGRPVAETDVVFRTLFAAYPDALVVADALGDIVLANPAAETLLGYESGMLLGVAIDALVPDGVRPRHAAFRQAYARNPQARPMGAQMELVARRRDGSEVMVEIALSPLQSHGLPLVVAAIRGIGAYPRVKQALQRARYSEHLAQLGRLAVDARDPQDLLRQVAVIAVQALQVEAAEVYLLDADCQQFHIASAAGPSAVGREPVPNRPDTLPGFVLAQGVPVNAPDLRAEKRFVLPPASTQAPLTSALAVPMVDRGRATGVVSVRSRDARRFGDDELHFLEALSTLLTTRLQRAQSEEALNHAQRLESVGQLTGGIAHDFNNLLTVIQGNLQVLEELPSLAADAHGRQLVAAALRAAGRGAELTGKLLAFARRQVLQPEAVEVATMLRSLADMLRRTLDHRIVIDVAVEADCPWVLADPGQLESALLNIAINARDAMPDGGTLRFRAEPVDALPVALHGELDDPQGAGTGFVALAVSDTGCGMPDEVKERAFEPFFTTKLAGRGTGLGLSTVYGFVKQSRGAVAIDTGVNGGTTLTLYLPQRPAAERAANGDAHGVGVVPPGLRVLLVEDDVEVRKVVLAFLQALGCRVVSAASGEEALLLLSKPASFDLLLTDIALDRGMRGTQLAREAQQREPRLAVLLMSGYSAELLQADRESPPRWELLRKPYGRPELADAIARVMGSVPASER